MSSLNILRCDLANLPQIETYADIAHRGIVEDVGEELAQNRPASEFIADIQSTEDIVELYLLQLNDQLNNTVGLIEFIVSDINYPDAAQVFLRILDDFSGYGFGTEALAFAKKRTHEHGRKQIIGLGSGRSDRDDHATRFIRRHRGTEVARLLRQYLRISNIDTALLQTYVARCPGNYDITVTIGVPSEANLQAGLDLYHNNIDPVITIGETRTFTEALHNYKTVVAAGRIVITALAHNKENGELVGACEFQYGPQDPLAEQLTLIVATPERLRGIGRAITAAAILAIYENPANATGIRTLFDDRINGICEINSSLGFHNVSLYRDWAIPL
ncbi:MAG: hypothetical protein ACRDAX_09390 [Propionibacteriaceae bacterium]